MITICWRKKKSHAVSGNKGQLKVIGRVFIYCLFQTVILSLESSLGFISISLIALRFFCIIFIAVLSSKTHPCKSPTPILDRTHMVYDRTRMVYGLWCIKNTTLDRCMFSRCFIFGAKIGSKSSVFFHLKPINRFVLGQLKFLENSIPEFFFFPTREFFGSFFQIRKSSSIIAQATEHPLLY